MIEKEPKENTIEILEKIIRVELDFISSSLNKAYKIGDDLQDIILEVTKSLDRISYFYKGIKYFKKRDRFDWRKWQEVGWGDEDMAKKWFDAGWRNPVEALEWYQLRLWNGIGEYRKGEVK